MSDEIVSKNNMFPNLWHSDKWNVTFSNIPSLTNVRDMRLFDNYVKSVTFPDYNMQEIFSDFLGFRIRHPDAPKFNNELTQLTVEFKLSEDMKNYLYLFKFMKDLRYGDAESEEDFVRKANIKSININILDNQKRDIVVWSFTECFLVSLGSLPLVMGASDEVTFTCNFSYEEIKYRTVSIG
jgi:hypothetical protein